MLVIWNWGALVSKTMVGPSVQRRSTDSVDPVKVESVWAISKFTVQAPGVYRKPAAYW
jgi:hypothetical protein